MFLIWAYAAFLLMNAFVLILTLLLSKKMSYTLVLLRFYYLKLLGFAFRTSKTLQFPNSEAFSVPFHCQKM